MITIAAILLVLLVRLVFPVPPELLPLILMLGVVAGMLLDVRLLHDDWRAGDSLKAEQRPEPVLPPKAPGFVSVHPTTGKEVWILHSQATRRARDVMSEQIALWKAWPHDQWPLGYGPKEILQELYAYGYGNGSEPSPFVIAYLGLDNGGVGRSWCECEKLLQLKAAWPELPDWASC
jgi:hypothetical protein